MPGAHRHDQLDPHLVSLADRVRTLRAGSTAPRVVIGIAGAPASGKSTLAERLVRLLAGREDWRGSEVAHLPMDGFHLADAELVRLGRRDRKGAPDTFDAAGYAALLSRVRAGESGWAPSFERDLEQPIAQALPIGEQVRIVISEGNYLLLPDDPWPRVRKLFDEVWFCRSSAQTRDARLLARHVQFGKTPDEARRWISTVDRPNADLVVRTEAAADLVIDSE